MSLYISAELDMSDKLTGCSISVKKTALSPRDEDDNEQNGQSTPVVDLSMYSNIRLASLCDLHRTNSYVKIRCQRVDLRQIPMYEYTTPSR